MFALAKRVAGRVRGQLRRCDHNVGTVFAFACAWCERDAQDRRVVLTAGKGSEAELRRVLSPEWRDQVMP